MTEHSAPTVVPIHELLTERYSGRAFAPTSVTEAELHQLLEAARWSPSSSNEQPWRWVAALRDDQASFARILGCLVPSNQEWAKEAGALFIICTKLDWEKHKTPNRHAYHDVGLTLMSLIVEAVSLGLMAHPMGGFDQEKARSELEIPAGFDPVTALAIGRVGDPTHLSEKNQAREKAPRVRKAIGEVAFIGKFGNSYNPGA